MTRSGSGRRISSSINIVGESLYIQLLTGSNFLVTVNMQMLHVNCSTNAMQINALIERISELVAKDQY